MRTKADRKEITRESRKMYRGQEIMRISKEKLYRKVKICRIA